MYDNLTLILGEYALEHRFWLPKGKIEEKKQLNRLMAISPTGRVADMCYLKLHRLQLDRIIVDAVLRTISQLERIFILKRYQDKQSVKFIECTLNMTKSKQIRIHKKICRQIGNILLYRLNQEDIYQPRRVMNILNVIDSRLIFLKKNDTLKDRVGDDWFIALESYRMKNSNLLAMQSRCITSNDGTALNTIVACKLAHPDKSNVVIGKMTNYTPANVSINLKIWEKKCYEIFE